MFDITKIMLWLKIFKQFTKNWRENYPTIVRVVRSRGARWLVSGSVARAVSSSGTPQWVYLSRNAEKPCRTVETVGVTRGVHIGACCAGKRSAGALRAVVTFCTGVTCGPSVHWGVWIGPRFTVVASGTVSVGGSESRTHAGFPSITGCAVTLSQVTWKNQTVIHICMLILVHEENSKSMFYFLHKNSISMK